MMKMTAAAERFTGRKALAATRMDFHGAMGRGAWRLVAGGGGAELELADGKRYSAETVGELVRGQLGWAIPVENLSWWVRGVQAPGPNRSANPGRRRFAELSEPKRLGH